MFSSVRIVDGLPLGEVLRSDVRQGPALIFGQTVVELDPDRVSGIGRLATVEKDELLCLVTQHGRTFQHEFPDLPVLLDRGRYLLVKVPARQADILKPRTEPCFKIEQVSQGAVVYENRVRQTKVPSARLSTHDEDLVRSLNSEFFSEIVRALTAIDSRLSIAQGFATATEFCSSAFERLGYQVSMQSIEVGTLGRSSNILARRPGVVKPPRLVVMAHLDSINHIDGPQSKAPGADDNASGCAGVLLLADALAAHEAVGDVLFVLFGGEEQGLFGSRHLVVDGSSVDSAKLVLALNMDMIASLNAAASGASRTPSVLIEAHRRSAALVDRLVAAAHNHTQLKTSVSFNPFASDHIPFIEGGMHAALTIEGEDATNDRVHTANDLPDHLDMALAIEILRMNLAFILETISPDETG